MKTVVITGSARGFGLEMLKVFRLNDFNIIVCDINEKSLEEAYQELIKINSQGKILSFKVDVTNSNDIASLIIETIKKTKTIDIWINNAGVNQPNEALWDLDITTINKLIDIDLKGTIVCSKLIMQQMIKQGSGQIFNVEGHGSNDAKIMGLSLYGTTKRAITYYTEALAYEAKQKNTNILVGKITPGIMITNFINTSLGDGEKIMLDEKTKKIYNILGDYPETIANYIVPKIIHNKENNVKFVWLTNFRAFSRFLTCSFKKRYFFN